MDLSVEEFIDGLFSKEATEQPSDVKKPDDEDLVLPEWFDEKKFNQARRFFWDNCFMFVSSMLNGLVAVFAVPSILRVLIGSRRSTSLYTAYKRYVSTNFHTLSWFEHELKPGSVSWKSLATVRNRHYRAGLSSKLKGQGVVSQRDLALTQFGFMGFVTVKPDSFAVRQFEDGDWEAYIHFWRTIGHLLGIEDKYNICRKDFAETREVCQILLDRYFAPCLDNVPEYFEHMSRIMLDALWCMNPTIDIEAVLYWTKYLANVPGYIYTENDRINIIRRIKDQLNGKSLEEGVESGSLMSKPALEDVQPNNQRLLYIKYYQNIESSPPYKRLRFPSRYKLALINILCAFYNTSIGRWYLNFTFKYSSFLMKNLPYLGFFRFGIMASYVNMFVEDPADDTKPKPNSEYEKPKHVPWYKEVLSLF